MLYYKFFRVALWRIAAVILPLGLNAQGVHIGTGVSFVMNGPVNLVLNDAGLTKQGNFIAGQSTVLFTGNLGGGSFISGSSAVSFNNININKIANDVQLNSNIIIGNTLTMGSGNLLLNNHIVDFSVGAPGIIGETENSRITATTGGIGPVQITAPHGH